MSAAADEPRSRVFRQVVTIEVFWFVSVGVEPPYTDMEAVVRDALTGQCIEGTTEDPALNPACYVLPGEGTVSDVEELEPRP